MTRTHNEWFRTVSLKNRKSCPTCWNKLPPGESIWSWGEYAYAKWRTITHFCVNCYDHEVRYPLIKHREECGCDFELISRSGPLPKWLTLPCPTKNQSLQHSND